ncbi:acyltransferase [Agromyces rhizosphaerae]|uniref:Acyltransferase n=1 Tax=Agromyces rhizosphaerae TaxID=88374 RepID=A0A9W6CRV5_9MICO|nr:acyltransferase [Agromyces rhizosphaerae]GLI27358.1 acyltransferase [Agromyces rhizosphaerae]
MKPPPPGRFLALDGLRGVAALAVLVFHMFWNSASAGTLAEWMPAPVIDATGLMRSGVAIFFVISGFVIAYTTAKMRTLREGGRFALRRQVRLDPPYYVVIAAVLLIEFAQTLVPGLVGREFTALDVLVNMVYLQDILGVPSVLAVAWTLCLEVQFYLVVVLLAIVAARTTRSEAWRGRVVVWSAAALALASLTMPLVGVSSGPWVLGVWWMFAIGMLLAWHTIGTVRTWHVAAAFAVLLAWGALRQFVLGQADAWGGEWFAIGTGLLIWLLIERDRLAASPGRVLLYFGRISYPLYLVHLPVIAVVAGAGFKAFPDAPWAQLLIVLASGGLAILAAEALHRWVEVPAIGWSRRLRRNRVEADASVGRSEAG